MEQTALKNLLNHHTTKGKKGSVHIAMATNLKTIQKVRENPMRAAKIHDCKDYQYRTL